MRNLNQEMDTHVAPESPHRPWHAFEEHTGELRLRVSAPTVAQLFVEAGRALAHLLAEERPGELQGAERVVLQARDRPTLLVEWLNELIFLSETRKRIYSDFTVHVAEEQALVADVRGWPATRLRTQVKAATLGARTCTPRCASSPTTSSSPSSRATTASGSW
jgi:SHS2 domain-containing protein